MAIMKNAETEQAAIGAGLVTASLVEAGAIAKNGTVSNLISEGAKNMNQSNMVELGQAAVGLIAAAGPVGWIAAGLIGAYLLWDAID